MSTWGNAIGKGMLSGSIASVASTIVLSLRGQQEEGTAYAPTNATSHWLWGQRAIRRNGPSARYTLVGYAIHHASSTLWAVIYEKWLGQQPVWRSPAPVLAGGTAVAALACFVDYRLTPKRLRPGFEQRLSKGSLVLVYGAFGLALGIRGLLAARLASHRQHQPAHSSQDRTG